MSKITKNKALGIATKVLKKLENTKGYSSFEVLIEDDQVSLITGNIIYEWEILEYIKIITDYSNVSWGVEYSSDKKCLQLYFQFDI